MELPPSSYHYSLEELWDEEEEPEEVGTVLKVFPSFNHQYLDVFSKVKAETLPPHRAYTSYRAGGVSTSSWGDLLFIQTRVRYTHSLHSRECRERFHPAKLLFNRSTCPLCQKERWWPPFEC
ncbi:hypothetical protein O181_123317 [Austropuccinia psidii MF-1]|uniref:Uncharacterized protein n=1 Tax=Austropuccinia psidii MF-1 TaxID=1389203 RepID=A0A9Q3KMG8_9BASI|nr:hypothetical protein [Austropuccinia psidii MF-1]